MPGPEGGTGRADVVANKKKKTRVKAGGTPTSSSGKKKASSSTRNSSSTRKKTSKRSPSGQGNSGGGKKSARGSGGEAKKKVTSKKKSTPKKTKSVAAEEKKRKAAAKGGKVNAKTKVLPKKKAPLKKKVLREKKKPVVKEKTATSLKSKTKVCKSEGRSKAAVKAVLEKKKPMSAALRRALRGPKAGMLDTQVPAASIRGGGGTSKRAAKSRLSAVQLQHFEELLREKRNNLIDSVRALEDVALRGDGDGATHKAFHPDDQGPEAYDQDFKLLLAASERTMLEEIDEALKRIENGTFGICEVTRKPIPAARLEAKPWARVCIEVAQAREHRSMFSS